MGKNGSGKSTFTKVCMPFTLNPQLRSPQP
jgi:ABC-type Mn2+/Zn2+ transport system ATPase subunit